MANVTISDLANKTAVATDEIEVQATGGGASNKVTLLSAMGITSPTLVTPVLGVATATTINKVTITAPAAAATLTIPNGVTLTGPASSGTAMTLGNAETVTGAKSFTTANITVTDVNVVLGTTTGTKIGTATAQKLGFWNATPVVQQVLATGGGATADNIITLLQTLGLCKQS